MLVIHVVNILVLQLCLKGVIGQHAVKSPLPRGCKQGCELLLQPAEACSLSPVLLQVVMSTDNLYTRCRQRSYVPHPQETHPLKQLDAIGNYVSDLLVICKQQSRAGGQGAATAAAAAGGGSSNAAATAATGAGGSMSGQQTAVAASG